MCVCEVRSVAVLSDGRVCSPPPHLIESAGLRPRLFQPQLIECICTRLHNDRWVSPQLPFFFLMFSKNDKAGLCFLAPLSLCISVCLFFLCLFLLPNFPKIGVGKKKKKKKDVEFVSSLFYFTWEEKEEEREDSLGWCRAVCLPHFLVALLLLSVGHKVTKQDSGSQSIAAWSAEFCPKALPREAISPFCSRFRSVNLPNIYSSFNKYPIKKTKCRCNKKITIDSYFYLIISNYPKLNYIKACFCDSSKHNLFWSVHFGELRHEYAGLKCEIRMKDL